MHTAPASYLFCSARLGFRGWLETDMPKMAAINADPEVMAYFPAVQSLEQTAQFIARMQHMQREAGFCYFALERLDTGQLIGFTGLAKQQYPADFTPCVDIGWRLARSAWGNGFATEAARRCLDFAWQHTVLDEVLSIAPKINEASIAVMQKSGMQFRNEFIHPLLLNDRRLRNCVLYRIGRPQTSL